MLQEHNKERVISILAKAFEHNISVNYAIFPGEKKQQRIRDLIDYSYEIAKIKGEILINSSFSAAAIFTYSDKKVNSFRQFFLDLKLIYKVIGFKRAKKLARRSELLRSFRPKTSYIYLGYIGVDPLLAQKGEGTAILKQVMAKAEDLKIPIYLETSMQENLPFYKKHGFEVYHQENVNESGYITYFIRKA